MPKKTRLFREDESIFLERSRGDGSRKEGKLGTCSESLPFSISSNQAVSIMSPSRVSSVERSGYDELAKQAPGMNKSPNKT